ncbi:MAG: class I SAM-dependent methyltransferase [Vicinamibacterales bacterium]|nr:class I SAM-dependent methyltransferase [Vicinamibacterales bacterium]
MSTTSISCAICGGTRTRRLYTKSGYDIARCVRCGLVYANPRAPRDIILGRYSRDYFWNEYLPALGIQDGTFDLKWFDTRYAPLLGLLGPAAGRRLLEVGSGAGFFLKSAERAGWSVTGIELSEEASRFGRERLGLDIRGERAEAASVGAASVDAAVMFDTIEHLFDPRAVLTSVASALVPGGQLLISTPNFRALSRLLLGSPWAVLSPLEHMYYFEEKSLNQLLGASGFVDVTFIRRHESWIPQETMNFVHTHEPYGLRARLAALLGRVGGSPLAHAVQRAGRQDILLCLARRG